MNREKPIKVYTDGGCNGTPGRGGWAAIIEQPNEPVIELCGGMELTTNNRMEIMGVLEALSYLQGHTCEIVIYSDSQYVVKSINEWLSGWVKKNFAGKKNDDLWRRVADYKKFNPKIRAQWIKGHNGHRQNERCDQLAGEIMAQQNYLPIDKVCAYNYSITNQQ